jgi:hypothetical protein
LYDGRSEGTSSRSYHAGDTASFQFQGKRLKLFAVEGPTGGYAELRIDGKIAGILNFYAPKKAVDALIYAGAALPAGSHSVEIVVAPARVGQAKRRFVNLDGAAYSR